MLIFFILVGVSDCAGLVIMFVVGVYILTRGGKGNGGNTENMTITTLVAGIPDAYGKKVMTAS